MEIKHYSLKGVFLFVLLALFSSTIFATTTESAAFSTNQANRTLDKLSIQLSIQNLNVRDLKNAVTILTKLQLQAKECVEDAQGEINEINKLWAEAKTGVKDTEQLTTAQTYLKNKKGELTRRRSECRLFVLRSGEAIAAFSKTSKALSTKKLLEVKPNFWAKITASTKLTKELHAKFSKEIFMKQSGLNSLNEFNLTVLGVLLAIMIMIGFLLKSLIRQHLKTKFIETFADKLRLTLMAIGSRYIIWFFIFTTLSIFAVMLDAQAHQITYFGFISYGILIYISTLTLIHFFFYPYKSETSISAIPENISLPLAFRLKILATLTLVGFIIYIIFRDQFLPQSAIDLARTIFITLFAINLISILWLINRVPKLFKKHRWLRFLVNLVLTCGLLTVLVAEWLGYQPLVTYILRGVTLTLLIGFMAWLVCKLLMSLLQGFAENERPWQESFHQHLGLKRHKKLPELMWLRTIFYILIWGSFLIALLKIWFLSEASFNILINSLTNGFKVAGLEIIPSRILSAFIFFTVVFLIIRWIKATLEMRSRDEADKGAQEALAAIVGYVGIAVATLIALLIAGVNFAGLAIIAGALSVGIGFGLQNIVNNFVSGIILLIERPIKPGDRIMVGETEGFVKKISIRSTQIKTLQFSDLIVPNSEIISKQVTNLMFHDFYSRVSVSVGVAYGSDTELVKKVMLEVAEHHPEVISNEGPYQPLLLFKEFGNSSLIFKMYCVVRNVNLRYIIQSELNFAIDKAFRENNIVIAFPQQDVHIKELPKEKVAEVNQNQTSMD